MKINKNKINNIIILLIIINFISISMSAQAINCVIIDKSFSETIYVGGTGPNNYTKIQDAIDNASNGDTIYVYRGSYTEYILISKEINLVGELKDQTIIKGNYTNNIIRIIANNVKVESFTLKNGRIGVYIVDSSNFIITRNSILDNWEGIGTLNASNGLISNNSINNNDFEGINPVSSTQITISGNNIENSLEGIFLSSSTSNTIYGNTIKNHIYGLEAAVSSNSNKIYHNNFLGNDQNAKDEFTNTWDDSYPSGGNYWDDYNGNDNNGDGIGDSPYNIPGGNNKDRYPLMDPWVETPTNNPPGPPTIQGARYGKANIDYLYNFSTIDPDDDKVYFYIDWGDGNKIEWAGAYNSSEIVSFDHKWNTQGSYVIRIKAKDVYNAESQESTMQVSIPRNRFSGIYILKLLNNPVQPLGLLKFIFSRI